MKLDRYRQEIIAFCYLLLLLLIFIVWRFDIERQAVCFIRNFIHHVAEKTITNQQINVA